MAVSTWPSVYDPMWSWCMLTKYYKDYPAYELYTDVLRKGIFGDEAGKQLRLIVGRDRRVKEVRVI